MFKIKYLIIAIVLLLIFSCASKGQPKIEEKQPEVPEVIVLKETDNRTLKEKIVDKANELREKTYDKIFFSYR